MRGYSMESVSMRSQNQEVGGSYETIGIATGAHQTASQSLDRMRS